MRQDASRATNGREHAGAEAMNDAAGDRLHHPRPRDQDDDQGRDEEFKGDHGLLS